MRRRQARSGAARSGFGADDESPLLAAWQENEPDLRRLIAAYGVERGRVDDCLQDVYLSAMESPTAAADLRRWLFRVAINRCRLEYRRGKRWRSLWERLRQAWVGSSFDDPAQTVAGDEERSALRRALAGLEPETRLILVMRYYSGLTSTDIGQVLDVPASTIRGQLRVGRQRLAERLRREGFGDEEFGN